MVRLFVVLAVLNVADIVVTVIGLAGGASESNPYMAPLLPGGYALKLMILGLVLIALRLLYQSAPQPTLTTVWVMIAIYAYVVASNVAVVL